MTALYQALAAEKAASASSLLFLAGAVIWVLVFIFLPKPDTIYVFGHEATHAIFGWISGGKLKGMKVNSSGGETLTTKSNFLITLSPYFFPFYAVLVIIAYVIGSLLWNWSAYSLVFFFLLGAAYAFHISYTFHTLKTEQPDIAKEGYIFSGAVILLCNLLILLLGASMFSPSANIPSVFSAWLSQSAGIYENLLGLL